MNRTFHQKLTPQALAAIVLLAACALWCLLVRTGATPFVGLLCLVVGAAAVDRTVNTTYVFAADGTLTITRGRLGRRTVIAVDEIISVRQMRGGIVTASHIIIEYGRAQRYTYAQPSDPQAFIAEVKRRQGAPAMGGDRENTKNDNE